jgi:hypothetical protein
MIFFCIAIFQDKLYTNDSDVSGTRETLVYLKKKKANKRHLSVQHGYGSNPVRLRYIFLSALCDIGVQTV